MLSDEVKGKGAWCERMTNEGERCVKVIVLGCERRKKRVRARFVEVRASETEEERDAPKDRATRRARRAGAGGARSRGC